MRAEPTVRNQASIFLPQSVSLGGVDFGGVAVQRLVIGGQRVQLGDHGIGPELLHGGIVAGHDALVQRPGLLALDHQVIGGNLPGDRLHALRKQRGRIDRLRGRLGGRCLGHAEARGQHSTSTSSHVKSFVFMNSPPHSLVYTCHIDFDLMATPCQCTRRMRLRTIQSSISATIATARYSGRLLLSPVGTLSRTVSVTSSVMT